MDNRFKYLIITLFFLLITPSFSIDIKVINKDKTPIRKAIIKVNNQIQLTNKKGISSFKTKDEILNITISKEGYSQLNFSLDGTSKENKEITLVLQPLKLSTATFSFSSSTGTIKFREVGTTYFKEVPFFKKIKQLILPFGTYEFIFTNGEKIKTRKLVTLSKDNLQVNVSFKGQPLQFFLLGILGTKKDISFLAKGLTKFTSLSGSTITIFKDSKIVKEIKFTDSFIPLELLEGRYDFLIKGPSNDNTLFKGVLLRKDSKRSILIEVPSIKTFISGVVKEESQLLGGVKVILTDVYNNKFETTTTFTGKFSIQVPPRKYKITIEKPGFTLNKDQNLIYDFSIPNYSYKVSLRAVELPSSISGEIFDLNGESLNGVTLTITSGGKNKKINTDKFGKFSCEVQPGFLFIKAEKEGYKAYGKIIKLERFSKLSSIQIKLMPFLINISGIVQDHISPIKEIPLVLKDIKGNQVAVTKSNENGFYEFPDIDINNKYFISVGGTSYRYFQTSSFKPTKEDMKDKNILLVDKKPRFFIHFKDLEKKSLPKVNVLINNRTYTTDTNGFLLLQLREGTSKLLIEIPKYKFTKKIDREGFTEDPNQLTIIVPTKTKK